MILRTNTIIFKIMFYTYRSFRSVPVINIIMHLQTLNCRGLRFCSLELFGLLPLAPVCSLLLYIILITSYFYFLHV